MSFKNNQILKDGSIINGYDQTLSPKEIDGLFVSLFGSNVSKDGKQFVVFNKIGILACNVTYLGWPHQKYKKRIQIKGYFGNYFRKNVTNNIKTVYLGIYTYKKSTLNETRLFVVFEPSTYINKKGNNSSAHVYSTNLQYAQKAGDFHKTDSFGNQIHIFKQDSFIDYIKQLSGVYVPGTYDEICELLKEKLPGFKNNLTSTLHGIDCIQKMRDDNFSKYRESEWTGSYSEYVFKKYINDNQITSIEWHEDKTDEGIDLDLKFPDRSWAYGDLKTSNIEDNIIGNAMTAFEKVMNNDGCVYYICCLFTPEKDSKHNYVVTKFWNQLRDHPYETEEEIANGYGKKMKYSVTFKKMYVLKIDKCAYEILKNSPFKQGRNSNGKPRKPKLKIKKDEIEAFSVFTDTF